MQGESTCTDHPNTFCDPRLAYCRLYEREEREGERRRWRRRGYKVWRRMIKDGIEGDEYTATGVIGLQKSGEGVRRVRQWFLERGVERR